MLSKWQDYRGAKAHSGVKFSKRNGKAELVLHLGAHCVQSKGEEGSPLRHRASRSFHQVAELRITSSQGLHQEGPISVHNTLFGVPGGQSGPDIIGLIKAALCKLQHLQELTNSFQLCLPY